MIREGDQVIFNNEPAPYTVNYVVNGEVTIAVISNENGMKKVKASALTLFKAPEGVWVTKSMMDEIITEIADKESERLNETANQKMTTIDQTFLIANVLMDVYIKVFEECK